MVSQNLTIASNNRLQWTSDYYFLHNRRQPIFVYHFPHNRFRPTFDNCFLTIVTSQTSDDYFLATITKQLSTTINRQQQTFANYLSGYCFLPIIDDQLSSIVFFFGNPCRPTSNNHRISTFKQCFYGNCFLSPADGQLLCTVFPCNYCWPISKQLLVTDIDNLSTILFH